jgi:GNAT superfamily N-acetyltransferase
MITAITFEEIYPIWRDYLWPGRVSAIEPNSAMRIFGEKYDMENMISPPTFFAYMEDDRIAGVNSGHWCKGNSYRSRGLYVFPQYRKRGIGTKLLLATAEQAQKESVFFVWSYPKIESTNTYKEAGFTIVSNWETSETGTNAYCIKII